MAKKRKKVALAYLITIFVTFVLIGGTTVFLYLKLGLSDNNSSSSNSEEDKLVFKATEEQNQTVLFVLDTGDNMTDTVFVVSRFLPTQDKIVLIPVQSDTFSQINTQKNTVYNFYKTGGVMQASTAIENAFNIKIQKYMKFNKDAFQSFVDIFGGVNYNIPYDLIYDNETTGESTIIRSGNQFLDSIKLRQLFTFPQYKEGEQYRAKTVGTALTDIINRNLGERLYNTIDSSFNTLINKTDTNITAYDYQFRKDAILNMITPGKTPVQFQICSGKYNEHNQFEIDDTSKENIKFLFNYKTESEDK